MNKICFLLISACSIFSGCNKPHSFLYDHDFTSGNWLLVNENDTELEIIDDEEILKTNKNGICITPFGDCKWTTCDGILKLYKDGKLISEKGYLTRSALYESKGIKEAYKKGMEFTIEPVDKNELNRKWDSLVTQNYYPTIYHAQPADKDELRVYKFK
jgi:hypothetical protein